MASPSTRAEPDDHNVVDVDDANDAEDDDTGNEGSGNDGNDGVDAGDERKGNNKSCSNDDNNWSLLWSTMLLLLLNRS
jgi:hypothetical protein